MTKAPSTTRFFKNKLVRDKIVELYKEQGVTCQAYVIEDDNEFLDAITQKMIEELQEVFSSQDNDELLAELADLEDALAVFKKFLKIDQKQIDTKRSAKLAEKGSYEGRLFLEYIDVPNSNKALIEKCEKEAERYSDLGLDEFDIEDDLDDEDAE